MQSPSSLSQTSPNAPNDNRLYRTLIERPVIGNSDVYRDQVLELYVLSDTIRYWADSAMDRVLVRRQEQAWNDLHAHAACPLVRPA
jgi:chaperone required for assembly of F1-ATPase